MLSLVAHLVELIVGSRLEGERSDPVKYEGRPVGATSIQQALADKDTEVDGVKFVGTRWSAIRLNVARSYKLRQQFCTQMKEGANFGFTQKVYGELSTRRTDLGKDALAQTKTTHVCTAKFADLPDTLLTTAKAIRINHANRRSQEPQEDRFLTK